MAKTYQQIMDEARQQVPEVSPDEVRARLGAASKPVVLDVREKEEFRQGYIPGAVSVPRGFLEMRVEEKVPDKAHARSSPTAPAARARCSPGAS